MAIFQLPRTRPLDSDTDALPGAKLYFYRAGTSTEKAVYSDATLSTPHANPVVADASGEFAAIWLDGTYKVVLKTSADVTVWTVDNVSYAGGGAAADYEISVVDYGAVGDGATDDTDAFQTAADSGFYHVYVPPGTYLVDTVEIADTQHWRLSPEAIVKMRSAYNGTRAVFDFASTATGSSIEGGTIDGNRATLAASYTANLIWCGLRALNVDDFSFRDMKFQNCIAMGWTVQGARMIGTNIRVENCGKGSQAKECDNSVFSNLTYVGIGNATLDIYQHCTQWRDSDNMAVSNVAIYAFDPDDVGREPTPTAFAVNEVRGLYVSNIMIDGYTGTSDSDKGLGFNLQTVDGCTVSGLKVKGYPIGCRISSSNNITMSGCHFDGEYCDFVNHGIVLDGAGIVDGTGELGNNSRAPFTSRDVHLLGCTFKRYSSGVQARGVGITFTGCQVYGCTGNGVVVEQSEQDGTWGVEAPMMPENVTFSGCQIFNNGGVGVNCAEFISVAFNDCRIYNNGQDTALDTSLRSGLATSVSGDRQRLEVINCFLGDTQTFTTTGMVSFVPGTTDGDNRYTLRVSELSHIAVGQWITVVDGAGVGSDISGKIVDIDFALYSVTIETAAAQTFTATGNLVALTGTFSVSGTTLTGTGSLLETEIKPYRILKIAGQYVVIRRVNDDEEAVLDNALTGTISGATAEIVECDLEGIPSQTFGLRLPGSPAPTGPYFIRQNRFEGLLEKPFSIGGSSYFGPGSEVIYATDAVGEALNTGLATTTLISSLGEGWKPVGARAEITEAITGTDGTVTYEFADDTGSVAVIGTSSTYTLGTAFRSDAPTATLLGANGRFRTSIAGGADNIPSGGKVRVELMVRAPTYTEGF